MPAAVQLEGGGPGGVPGDPAALEAAADAAASAGQSVGDVSENLRTHGNTMTERWTGATADAASERVRLLSERSDIGREVLASLATVVRDYAGELRAAQAAHAAAVADLAAGRSALTLARNDVAALGVSASPASSWDSLLDGPSALTPGPDPGTAIQAVAAQNRVADAQAAMDNASSAVEAAFAAEARANADAALRVRTLVVELSSMTVETSFPPAHASDPTHRVAAGNPVPGTNPAWLTGRSVPPLGGRGMDVVDVGIGVLSNVWDDVAFVVAAGAVLGEVGLTDDPDTPGVILEPAFDLGDAWGTSMARTDGWKQKIADHFGVDLEDPDVELGEELATGASLAFGVKGIATGAREGVTKVVAHQAEKALAKSGARELDEATKAGDDLVAAAQRRGEQQVADAAPEGPAAVEAASEQAALDEKLAQREASRLLADRPGPRQDPFTGEHFDPRRGLTPEEYDRRYGDFYHRDYPRNEGFRLAVSEPNTVQVGAVLDRFGDPTGRYLAPGGTPWEERALPVSSLDQELHRYRVLKELPPDVLEGPAAKVFGQPGGGRQYYTGERYTVDSLIDKGYLEEMP